MKLKTNLLLLPAMTLAILLAGCQKEIKQKAYDQPEEIPTAANIPHGHLKQTNTFSSDVIVRWMDMQLQIMKTASGIPNVVFSRPYAYSGITLYEAVVAGMPAYQSLAGQLTGLSDMPKTKPGFAYHWPSAANTAMASINKLLFPTTSAANKAAIDALENELNTQYANDASAETISRSMEYGKAVAQKIFAWAETDGYLHASDPYTPPTGPGLWVPPSIPLPAGSTPYWGDVRLLVAGSNDGAQPAAPVPYSEDPASDFYKMVKQVYDVSQTLTADQTAWALFWRDVPGVTTPGHYVSILKQVLQNENPKLDKAAFAYALGGITEFDASISTWKTKYNFNLVRPITYIRTVLGHATWSPLLTTPPHPEYSSAHATLSAASAAAFTNLFGENYSFTDHTYDYLGWSPRSFSSFEAFGADAGNSRIYAGIHYQASIDIGLEQGRKVAENVINKLKFLKE